jgi:FdhD protein
LLCTPENLKELETGFLFTQGLICNDANKDAINQDAINRVSTDVIFTVMDKLHKQQRLFNQTGGSHAAGIFTAQGQIVAFAEDVARHNAFDKTIGMCLLNKINMKNCGVVLSSRVSAEMMRKAITAELQMVVAVSAPTSLAIELTQQNNITLCGFVRDKTANVYT